MTSVTDECAMAPAGQQEDAGPASEPVVEAAPVPPKQPRRHRVLKPAIAGITKPALRRLARRGGVTCITDVTYAEARNVFKAFLERVIKDTVLYTAHARRKTVTALDVVHALKNQRRTIYGFDS